MKPPYCTICNAFIKDFDRGGLINFKKTQNNLEWEQRMKRENKVEHPPYAEWFCEDHYPIANQFSHLTWSEGMKKIREVLDD